MTSPKKSQPKKDKKQQIRITDTTLRDAHQSLWATRMRSEDIMKIIDTIDSVGYYSLEVWGGATFDVCLRFLRENPWERLRMIKSKAKKTPLQMLLRGQNLVGYKNFPDDLVDRFVAWAIENGIDIFRVFDALNDTRNLQAAIKAVKKYGAHAQGTLSYTISPVHTVEKYIQYAKEQVALGIDSICIKDMAGILSPKSAQELVGALTGEINIPIQLHCHATSGMAPATYISGVNAGAEAIDCAISSMAGFSSQPATETMYAIFNESDREIKLDIDAMRETNQYFTNLIPNRMKVTEFRPPIDAEILVHQIPGGMISNFRSQLEQQGALDKLPETLEEITRVRKDLGYPPLVTPTSQIVGTQAVLNVIAGERYKMVPNEVKNYLRGYYGRSPAPIDPAFLKQILGKEKPIDHRPADDLKPILPTATDNLDPKLIKNEEDILSYCLFPEPSLEYFKWRSMPPESRPKTPAEIEFENIMNSNLSQPKNLSRKKDEPVGTVAPILNDRDYEGISSILEKASLIDLNELSFQKGDLSVTIRANGDSISASQIDRAKKNDCPEKEAAPPKPPEEITRETVDSVDPDTVSGVTINAIITGTFYASPQSGSPPYVKEGSEVEEGETVCLVEAMKLFNEIAAPFKCTILKVLANNGDPVTKDQPLMVVQKH
jgi:oxaloacetate decarboxylase alpha subunit